MENITITTDELLAAYREELSEAHHQLTMLKIALNKANARVRELEALGQQQDMKGPSEAPKAKQVARQVAPGLNGAATDVTPS
jgi:hypothetical protein